MTCSSVVGLLLAAEYTTLGYFSTIDKLLLLLAYYTIVINVKKSVQFVLKELRKGYIVVRDMIHQYMQNMQRSAFRVIL